MNQPEIFFADEPSGNLDEKNALMLNELFAELNKKFNQAFLVVTQMKEWPLLLPDVFICRWFNCPFDRRFPGERRFTDRVKKVLQFAREEAVRLEMTRWLQNIYCWVLFVKVQVLLLRGSRKAVLI
jgi:ABC-type sugar transport system ATPase subunit